MRTPIISTVPDCCFHDHRKILYKGLTTVEDCGIL